jgi:hypothetical protein
VRARLQDLPLPGRQQQAQAAQQMGIYLFRLGPRPRDPLDLRPDLGRAGLFGGAVA